MARIQETIEYNSMAPNRVQALTFTIGQFDRARALAPNFRWYKATRVTWTIEPQFNVYQATAGGSTVPYVYTIMNRTQDSSYITLSDVLTQGARPVKLTNAKMTSYRPNWCSPGLLIQNVVATPGFGGMLNNVVVTGLKPEYGWLQSPNIDNNANFITPLQNSSAVVGQPANSSVANYASAVRYNGHQVYIDQQTNGVLTPTFRVTCKVTWVFKDPKNTQADLTDNIFTSVEADLPQPEEPV